MSSRPEAGQTRDINMAFRKDNKIKSNFSKITIGLASPEEIKE